jgi:hypothetical protein
MKRLGNEVLHKIAFTMKINVGYLHSLNYTANNIFDLRRLRKLSSAKIPYSVFSAVIMSGLPQLEHPGSEMHTGGPKVTSQFAYASCSPRIMLLRAPAA